MMRVAEAPACAPRAERVHEGVSFRAWAFVSRRARGRARAGQLAGPPRPRRGAVATSPTRCSTRRPQRRRGRRHALRGVGRRDGRSAEKLDTPSSATGRRASGVARLLQGVGSRGRPPGLPGSARHARLGHPPAARALEGADGRGSARLRAEAWRLEAPPGSVPEPHPEPPCLPPAGLDRAAPDQTVPRAHAGARHRPAVHPGETAAAHPPLSVPLLRRGVRQAEPRGRDRSRRGRAMALRFFRSPRRAPSRMRRTGRLRLDGEGEATSCSMVEEGDLVVQFTVQRYADLCMEVPHGVRRWRGWRAPGGTGSRCCRGPSWTLTGRRR